MASTPPEASSTTTVALGLQGVLSDATAVRLFHSIPRRLSSADSSAGLSTIRSEQSNIFDHGLSMNSVVSTTSSTESNYPCRICRCDEENVKVVKCPCRCRGSVGFVHLNCLKQWILHRRGSRCEICNTQYCLPSEQLGFRRMVKAFFSFRCAGLIMKHLILAASIIPLARVILHQVLICMDKMNTETNDQLSVGEVLLASCALLTSSLTGALFFNFFEYITRRFMVIRNILRQWWIFGDFTLVNPENIF